jgi:hypothetical protein
MVLSIRWLAAQQLPLDQPGRRQDHNWVSFRNPLFLDVCLLKQENTMFYRNVIALPTTALCAEGDRIPVQATPAINRICGASNWAWVCLSAALAVAPAKAAPQFSLSWPLLGSPLAPGLQYGYDNDVSAAWETTGSKLAPGETVTATASGALITCTANIDYACGIGTNFPLPSGTPYVITVNIHYATLAGTAGLILDNFPDVYVVNGGDIFAGAGGASGAVFLGYAQPDANGWITLGIASNGKVFSAGYGTPETGLVWTPLSARMRTTRSANVFASTEDLNAANAGTGSSLFAGFLISNP